MTHFAGKMVRMLLLSAISTVLLAGFAAAAESQQAVAVGATTGSSLRLRADASTSASVITTLDQDVAVAVLDDSIDGWYKVNYNGNVGYVSADYLVIDQDNVFTSYGRVSGDGDKLEIGFNNRYLLDALRNARTEQVKLEISGPLSPVKVLPTEGSDFLYLVLPVRFKND